MDKDTALVAFVFVTSVRLASIEPLRKRYVFGGAKKPPCQYAELGDQTDRLFTAHCAAMRSRSLNFSTPL